MLLNCPPKDWQWKAPSKAARHDMLVGKSVAGVMTVEVAVELGVEWGGGFCGRDSMIRRGGCAVGSFWIDLKKARSSASAI